ncbi:MAG: hypothetical protein DBX96_01240 [Propionibacterium sp.]|nr:MAG: hypothetical protein DBX96_01240 [Propionibacterium sp.]
MPAGAGSGDAGGAVGTSTAGSFAAGASGVADAVTLGVGVRRTLGRTEAAWVGAFVLKFSRSMPWLACSM